MTRRSGNRRLLPISGLLLLGACAEPAAAPGPVGLPVPPAVANNDTNVYQFERQGPDVLGNAVVTARPTVGPDAAPAGSMADPADRAKAEAAVAFYARNALCDGATFLPLDGTSRYDAAENSWTVYGRCAGA